MAERSVEPSPRVLHHGAGDSSLLSMSCSPRETPVHTLQGILLSAEATFILLDESSEVRCLLIGRRVTFVLKITSRNSYRDTAYAGRAGAEVICHKPSSTSEGISWNPTERPERKFSGLTHGYRYGM